MVKSIVRNVLVGMVLVGVFAVGCGAGGAKKAKRPKRTQAGLSVPEVSRDEVICFALYTVRDNVLKLMAQLYPLKDGEDRMVRLEVKAGGKWKQVAEVKVIEQGWTAPFRVENWDMTRDYQYRVAHGKKAF